MKEIDEILRNKTPLNQYCFPAIYFLILKNEIIYIGSTENLNNRISFHRKNKRLRFDSFYYISYDYDNLQKMRYNEALYIRKIKPKYNREFNPDSEKIKRILFFKYLDTYKSMSEFSEHIGLSVSTLNLYFNTEDDKYTNYIPTIKQHLFPNNENLEKNFSKKIRITDFKP